MKQFKRNRGLKNAFKPNFKKNLLLKKGNIEKIHFWENSHKNETDCIRSSFNRELYLVYLKAIS